MTSEESCVCQINDMECESQLSEQVGTNKKDGHARSFIGWPSSWDPYSKGIDADALKASLASHGVSTVNQKMEESRREKPSQTEKNQLLADIKLAPTPEDRTVGTIGETIGGKTLKDAVKPKHTRKKKSSSNIGVS